MWESFERRFEAEHLLGPTVRGQRLIDRLLARPAPMSDAALHAEIDPLSFIDLRAFYARTVELTGGPSGQDITPGCERWRPHRDALLRLRAAGGAALAIRTKARIDQLAAQDLASVEACAPIDKWIENSVQAAVAGLATDTNAEILAAAACDYRVILNDADVSEGGRRLLLWKIANALDNLGRACESRNRDAEAKIHFGAAAETFTEAGEANMAAASSIRRDAADQRLVPDVDIRLEQLLAKLAVAPEPSLARATVLAALADLANGNSDTFEASRWLGESVGELAAGGYAIPVPNGADSAVEAWIEAIPPGDGEDPMHFLRQFSAVLTVHCQVAGLRMALIPDTAQAAEAELHRFAEIVMEMPAHAQTVDARLAAQLGLPAAPGEPIGGQIGDQSGTAAEYLAIMQIVNQLLDLTESSESDAPETAAQWRQLADDCVGRARVLGQPLTLAMALEAAGRVRMVTGEPQAAIDLFEEEYAEARKVGGKTATDQAIIAMSNVAKAQLGLGLSRVTEASKAAGTVIDLIERDRYRVSAPFQQAALLASHSDVFAIGVFCAWKNADYDTMLQRMELSKARASVRRLFLEGSGDSAELDRQLGTLNDAIHGLDPAIDPGDPPDQQSRQREEARQAQRPLRRQRLQLWDRRAIARRDPDTQLPPVTLAGLQARLEPDEAVVYYYWLRSLTLLVVTITADAIAVESKPVAPDQRSLLERLIGVLGSLKGSVLSLDASYIAPLAPVLTPVEGLPLLEGKRRLIISPHRLLHWFPFAAMPYQAQPLIRSFAVRYAPNLTSLLLPRARRAAPQMTAALAVSKFPGRPDLGELSGVRGEAADITAVYSAAHIRAQLTSEPTRGQLLAALRDGALSDAWCLVVATHGHSLTDEVSRDAPLESVLELADGSVDGYEIAAGKLGCEVVVLTACYTGQRAIGGRGQAEQPGDELFGLSAAFLEARCGSVLAPAWPADDQVMARLMTAFHRHLAEGCPADIALAQAQRAFLDTAGAKEHRAYYWAPLILTTIGRPMPMPRT
jgi:CHAT domain-containing protein